MIRGLVAAGVTLCAASGLAATSAIAAEPAAAAGTAGNVSVTPADGRDYQQPSLALDPANAAHLVLAFQDGGKHELCGLARSGDGGRTWSARSLVGAGGVFPVPEGFAACWNPSVAFGAGGTVYYLFQTSLLPSNPYSHIMLAVSFVFPFQEALTSDLEPETHYRRNVEPHLSEHVAVSFEDVCRSWVAREYQSTTDTVAAWWGNALKTLRRQGSRSSEEIDVVGMHGGAATVVGEATWTRTRMPKSVLDDLRTFKIPALQQAGVDVSSASFVLLSRSGFMPALVREASASEVRLVNLAGVLGDAVDQSEDRTAHPPAVRALRRRTAGMPAATTRAAAPAATPATQGTPPAVPPGAVVEGAGSAANSMA